MAEDTMLLDSLIKSDPPDLRHIEVMYQILQYRMDEIKSRLMATVSDHPPLNNEDSLLIEGVDYHEVESED